jgi:fibronectin-binding autotransporter adhesin
MPGLTSWLRLGRRERTIGLAIATIVALSAWAPAAAHASGCTNTWTHTTEGSSASWFEAGNWSKGKVPSAEEEVCITEKGTYTVVMTQASATVSVKALTIGASSGTQTLLVGSSCSVNAVLTTTLGISVGTQGALTLTNGDGCGDGVKLVGPITNAGLITSEPAHGGPREIQGSLTNTGTLAINVSTAYNGAKSALSNEGAINLAEGAQLTVSGEGTLTNAGKIVGSGSGDVFMSSATTFSETTGKTVGTQPVIVDDATLKYAIIESGPKGAGLIKVRGTSTLIGQVDSEESLSIESTCGENVVAKGTPSGFANKGSITLTNGDGCGDNVTFGVEPGPKDTGVLTGSGTITSEPAHGGARTIEGNVVNFGTYKINANTTYHGSSETEFSSDNAVDIANGVTFTANNDPLIVNGGGNTIAGTGSGTLFQSGGTFLQQGGAISGSQPVVVDDATLNYASGGGAGLIALRGTSTLEGASVKGQALSIQSTCGENAAVTAPTGFTNGGSIALTNGDGCGDNATLTVSAGTLTSTGTISSEQVNGGARTLQGNLTNQGTLAINANTSFNGASGVLTNEGALNVAEGKTLTVSNSSSVTNGTGGKIAAGATGVVFLEPGSLFTEGAGTTSGTLPVIVRDGALSYTGSGASTIAERGEGGTLSGNLSAGQALSIQSTCGEHVKTTAGASFTNGGSITLTNGDGCGDNATLTVSAGTLTNSGKGTITTEVDHGGARALQGNIDNLATLAFNSSTSYNGSKGTLTNEGALNVAEGKALTVSGNGSVTNGAGGKIAAGATGVVFLEPGSAFTEGLGTTSGTLPVIVRDGALSYTGKGASTIALRGESSLSGTINAGQTLSIQSTCSEHAKTTAPGGFVSSGTIKLTNGDGCGDNATLNLSGGTLENKGTIDAEEPHGGTRTIEGAIKNEKTLFLAAGANLKVTGSYVQGKKGTLKTEINSASSLGVLSVTGTASIDGTLTLKQGKTFHAKAGETFAILSSSALTGTFAKETADLVAKTVGLYYKPTYSATGVTLLVTLATAALSSSEGPAGSTVTVSGGGYLPGDTIKLSFTDHKKAKTVLPSTVVNAKGEFSAEITVPPGAAEGAATINVKSTETGVSINKTFTVT